MPPSLNEITYNNLRGRMKMMRLTTADFQNDIMKVYICYPPVWKIAMATVFSKCVGCCEARVNGPARWLNHVITPAHLLRMPWEVLRFLLIFRPSSETQGQENIYPVAKIREGSLWFAGEAYQNREFLAASIYQSPFNFTPLLNNSSYSELANALGPSPSTRTLASARSPDAADEDWDAYPSYEVPNAYRVEDGFGIYRLPSELNPDTIIGGVSFEEMEATLYH
ncbi:hypothetical protein OF83DRAFT_562803 [Amylostereum chailletii]|nr:hypothetical protein OF83DRAFT_562803 [Amylostereum chailletii]